MTPEEELKKKVVYTESLVIRTTKDPIPENYYEVVRLSDALEYASSMCKRQREICVIAHRFAVVDMFPEKQWEALSNINKRIGSSPLATEEVKS